jgi:hypothetical protein
MTRHTTTIREIAGRPGDYAIDCAACGDHCAAGRGEMFTLVEAQRHTRYWDERQAKEARRRPRARKA